MPNPSLADALKEAYVCCPTGKVIYDTLEVRQDGVQTSLYFVRGRIPISARDETGTKRTFTPCGFQISLPPENEEGFRSLNIAIDNIGRTVSDFLTIAKSDKEPVKLIYRPYLSDNLEEPQMIPPLTLFLKEVQVTVTQVTGRATFMDVVNRKFPSELYDRYRFPSLQ